MANHEYSNEELMFPGFTNLDSLTVEQLRVAMAAHGMSIVEIERVGRMGAVGSRAVVCAWRLDGRPIGT